MKKLLFALLLVSHISLAQSFGDYESFHKMTVTEASLDPKSPNFCILYNPLLDIKSYYVSEKDIRKVFTTDDRIDRTSDDIWFSLHKSYYKLWLPKDSLLFVVKLPLNRQEILGNHLVSFVNILRMHYENEARTKR